jgi:hypothetical protein
VYEHDNLGVLFENATARGECETLTTRFVFAAAASACVALVACAIAQPASEHETPLRGERLREAIVGHELALGDVGAFERFCASGSYSHQQIRAPVVGRYFLQRDRFCVSADGESVAQCRHLFQNAEGSYFTTSVSSPDEAPAPVRLRPIPADSTC